MKKLLIQFFCLITIAAYGQNVGIGITQPKAQLHVAGGLSGYSGGYFPGVIIEGAGSSYLNFLTPNTLESGVLFGRPINAASAGIVYNNPANPDGLQFRTGGNNTAMTIRSNGNVGIGTNTPTEILEVAGNLKASSFKYSSPKTIYHSIHPSAFRPSSSADAVTINTDQAFFTSPPSSTSDLFAPVYLPHGAIVTGLTIYFVDNSATRDLFVALLSRAFAPGGSLTQMTAIQSTGTPGNTNASNNSIFPAQIDNQTNSYFIWARSEFGPWPSSDIMIRSILISYTITEAH